MTNIMVALPNKGGALCESSVIPFLVPRRKVWLTPAAAVPCNNAVNIEERKIQPLVGRSSPYCEEVWRRYCCLTMFFRLSIHALVAKIQPGKVVRWCADGDFLRNFCVLYFQRAVCSTFQTCILKSH